MQDSFYDQVEIKKYSIDDAVIAVRKYGQGLPLVLVHGFIVHGYTWRKLLPELAKHFTCYVVDLPGFGSSEWTRKTDFTFTAQADRLAKLFLMLQLDKYSIVAQDTGASIARMVAIAHPNTVERLVLINTEIPNHRPPFIPMHQFLAKLPGANFIFRSLLKVGFIVRSPLLLNQMYFDKSQLKRSENLDCYLNPLINSKHKMLGMLGYLKGIEWSVVDEFKDSHSKIQASTLFVWGENDKTFPIELAQEMVAQFSARCQFKSIPRAALMPQEEKPLQVLEYILPFLLNESINTEDVK